MYWKAAAGHCNCTKQPYNISNALDEYRDNPVTQARQLLILTLMTRVGEAAAC
jgi:hypothetical protein